MKQAFIIIGVMVIALGMSIVYNAIPAEVRATGSKVWWGHRDRDFEVSSVQTAEEIMVPVQNDVWNRFGSGFELTSVRAALATPVQNDVWNRLGSGFELSSVRTAAEIKASIQKYMWKHAESRVEPASAPAIVQ